MQLSCIGTIHTELRPPQRFSPIIIKAGSKVAVFTLLLRSVAVSRSQGLPWILRRKPVDYDRYYKQFTGILKQTLQVELVDPDRILDHPLYLAGRFPIRAEWHHNGKLLPIVTNREETKLMMRTYRLLEADYFVTALVDFSISKILLKPATVRARITFHIYSPLGGLMYKKVLRVRKVALPYDRSLSLGDLNEAYETQTSTTLDQVLVKALQNLQKSLQKDIIIKKSPKVKKNR